jgi:hypothetical protein
MKTFSLGDLGESEKKIAPNDLLKNIQSTVIEL